MSKGTVIETRKFETDGGKGLLTVLYLKGCPLKCTFCGRPESIKKAPEFMLKVSSCSLCSHCLSVCETNALYLEDERIIFNPQSCKMCDACQNTCPNEAIGIIGERVNDESVARTILEEQDSYEKLSVLLDGGEPFMQAPFTYNLMARLKNAGVETMVTTSGYAPWEYLENTAPYVDCFIYNLKHMDNEAHSKFAGVSNSLILENFSALCKLHPNVIPQYKIVPGFNESDDNARRLFRFIAENGVTRVRLSPFDAGDVSAFYQWQEGKKENSFPSLDSMRLAQIEELAREYGLTVVPVSK